MAKYDIEKFCVDLGAFLLANLSSKLSSISSEKGDGVALNAPVAGAYFFQTMNNAEANYDPYLFYGITNVNTLSQHGASAKTYEIQIMIVVADEGGDTKIANRMLRYLRGLEELMNENYSSVSGGLKITVKSLVPIPLTDINTEKAYRCVGVSIDVTIP